MVSSAARLRATPPSLSYRPFIFVPSFAPAPNVLVGSGCLFEQFFACLPLSVACLQEIMGVLEHSVNLGAERGHFGGEFGGRTWQFWGAFGGRRARVPY